MKLENKKAHGIAFVYHKHYESELNAFYLQFQHRIYTEMIENWFSSKLFLHYSIFTCTCMFEVIQVETWMHSA